MRPSERDLAADRRGVAVGADGVQAVAFEVLVVGEHAVRGGDGKHLVIQGAGAVGIGEGAVVAAVEIDRAVVELDRLGREQRIESIGSVDQDDSEPAEGYRQIAEGARHDRGVETGPANQQVIAQAADHRIVAVAAGQRVIAGLTIQDVITVQAEQRIVAVCPRRRVVAS